MENSDIMEEVILPERSGVLGSRSYRSVNGKILKTTRLNFCDNCGRRILGDDTPIVICHICSRKLCLSGSCAFEYQRKHYCEEHIQQVLPLSVHGFEVLHCIVDEVDAKKAREFASMTKDACEEALNELLEFDYIEKKGISFLTSYKILDKGIEAWKVYAAAYATQGDVAHFFRKLSEEARK